MRRLTPAMQKMWERLNAGERVMSGRRWASFYRPSTTKSQVGRYVYSGMANVATLRALLGRELLVVTTTDRALTIYAAKEADQ